MYTRLGRCQQISFTSGSLQTFLSFSLKQSVAIGHKILIIVRVVSYISHMINSEIKESSLKRIYREKEEHLRVLLCVVKQTWLPSWLPASATLPSSIPSIHSAIHSILSPYLDPTLSRFSSFFPPTLCLAPSLWFIEVLTPHSLPRDRRRFPAYYRHSSTKNRKEDPRWSERGDFPLPPPTSVGVSMSRCVGHCERTAAPRILPFVRFGMAYRLHFVTLTRQVGFRLTSHFSFLCILLFFFYSRNRLSNGEERIRWSGAWTDSFTLWRYVGTCCVLRICLKSGKICANYRFGRLRFIGCFESSWIYRSLPSIDLQEMFRRGRWCEFKHRI